MTSGLAEQTKINKNQKRNPLRHYNLYYKAYPWDNWSQQKHENTEKKMAPNHHRIHQIRDRNNNLIKEKQQTAQETE